jgi:hypothetical protein
MEFSVSGTSSAQGCRETCVRWRRHGAMSRLALVMQIPQNASLMRILMREVARHEQQAECARPLRDYIRVIKRDLSRELSHYLAKQLERGTARSLGATPSEQMITSALISVLMRRTAAHQTATRRSRTELTNTIVDLFLHGLAPPSVLSDATSIHP